MLNKKILFSFVFIILIFSGLYFYKNYFSKDEKIFTVIPHHNLVDKNIDEFYSSLKGKYWKIDNVVIISPNHFGFEDSIWFAWNFKYCYFENCLFWEKFDFLKNSWNIFKFDSKNKVYNFIEHWVWNHFKFLKKYFSEAKIFSVILKINKNYTLKNKEIAEKLKKYNFSGKTLFVASVDFSHHTNEKSAKIHDLKTFSFLNSRQSFDFEVDCPNCLYLLKDLANFSWKKFFNFSKRTSVDSTLKLNSNFENTTHFYWEFEEKYKNNFDFVKDFTKWFDKKEIFSLSYFWDFLPTKQSLKCFYSNKDFKKTPKFWFNRILYSYDLWIFQTNNLNLKEEFKESWFDYFWDEKFFEKENFLVLNWNFEIDFTKIDKNKKIIILIDDLKEKQKEKFLKEKVDFIFTKSKNFAFKKLNNTNIFYLEQEQALFLFYYYWKIFFETMYFDLKNWNLDCDSFN